MTSAVAVRMESFQIYCPHVPFLIVPCRCEYPQTYGQMYPQWKQVWDSDDAGQGIDNLRCVCACECVIAMIWMSHPECIRFMDIPERVCWYSTNFEVHIFGGISKFSIVKPFMMLQSCEVQILAAIWHLISCNSHVAINHYFFFPIKYGQGWYIIIKKKLTQNLLFSQRIQSKQNKEDQFSQATVLKTFFYEVWPRVIYNS